MVAERKPARLDVDQIPLYVLYDLNDHLQDERQIEKHDANMSSGSWVLMHRLEASHRICRRKSGNLHGLALTCLT